MAKNESRNGTCKWSDEPHRLNGAGNHHQRCCDWAPLAAPPPAVEASGDVWPVISPGADTGDMCNDCGSDYCCGSAAYARGLADATGADELALLRELETAVRAALFSPAFLSTLARLDAARAKGAE